MKLEKISKFLYQYKYELLLFGMTQHLFIGMVLDNLDFYAQQVWAINMFTLGIASIGVFLGKGRLKNTIKNVILFVVLLLPILYPFFKSDLNFMIFTSIIYFCFFGFIAYEVIKFLFHPSYINKDIITASACGFLLILEMSVFLVMVIFLRNPESFNGIEQDGTAAVFINLVYYCSITLTTIGYGDITPNSHSAKLVISLVGWIGQFYSVFLVGILVGKFSSTVLNKTEKED